MTFNEMKRLYLTMISVVVLAATVHGACAKMTDTFEEKDNTQANMGGDVSFAAKSGTFAGVQIPWREARINMDKSGDTALVIYLHGGSARGSDNAKQIQVEEVGVIASYLVRRGIKAIFIVPQCPSAYSWGGRIDKVLAGLIDSYGCAELYGFGGSMGGSGLASLISSYPEKFTAAMPVAWNPRMAKAESMAKVPFRTVVGTNDNIIDADKVKEFVSEVKALDGNVICEFINGWNHGQTCTMSYTDERLDWVFSWGR